MLVQLQWSLQFVIRFIWPSSAKRCQEEIGEMEKGAGGLLRNIEIRAFSGGFLRLSSIPLNENTGGAVGSGGGFEDVIHRMIAFQRLYGATKLAGYLQHDGSSEIVVEEKNAPVIRERTDKFKSCPI